ncbi:MAG: SAM-dependent methyltransferase [Verrucomicrobiae bacterium]|nr:SAM-dependent methyltransferase [Verrucomicrobiae bacterium]
MNVHQQFLEKFAASLANGTFVRLSVSDQPSVTARLVELKSGLCMSLTYHHGTRDVTKNIPVTGAVAWLSRQLAEGTSSAFLATTQRDWQLTPKGLVSHKPSVTTPPPRCHDRKKPTFLDESARDWLNQLGLAGASMANKRRQIARYLEIISHLASDCGWTGKQPLTVADMGCGKGYLTFALWHLLRRVRAWPARIIGVEARRELVDEANKLARQIGAEGLEFTAGTIRSVALPPLDALIALHACDTATDDAIRRGIELKTKLILVAPCCYKQMRRQLAHPRPLAAVLKHGIMAQRMAEWLTDGLRALHLEAAGYKTKLIEFVGIEHTPKNLMIAAVRSEHPWQAAQEALEASAALKSFFGISRHALD